MSVEIKFCGLTRPEDAAFAAELGAAFCGVIFAGGPRNLTVDRAAQVLSAVPRPVGRVGVFADQAPEEIGRVAERLGLDVVQLHAPADASRVAAVRRHFHGHVWPVRRVAGPNLASDVASAIAAGDGLLLDAFTPGALGGTGIPISWAEIAAELAAVRSATKPIVLAGGLRPENVAEAIAALSPDVVDVSSGVEASPGFKDHARMRAFRDAVLASIPI